MSGSIRYVIRSDVDVGDPRNPGARNVFPMTMRIDMAPLDKLAEFLMTYGFTVTFTYGNSRRIQAVPWHDRKTMLGV